MKPLYIFDLDGTLALIAHRRRFVEGLRKDWQAFYAACDLDEPNWPVIHTMDRLLQAGAEVWLFSGRSDEVREKTVAWLARYTSFMSFDLTPSVLHMRRAGNYTLDDQLKREWLDSMLVEDRQRLVAAFDDRDRLVRMWRDAGVTCFQVAPGEF